MAEEATEGSWYYADQGRQIGPVAAEAFDRLVLEGRIGPDTLVWHPGLDAWRPYREIVPPPAATVAGPLPSVTACSVCGRVFDSAQMLQLDRRWICADCKPTVVQQIKEGTAPSQQTVYGGFWWRALAWFIDKLVKSLVEIALFLPLTFMVQRTAAADGAAEGAAAMAMGVTILIMLLEFAFEALYEILLTARYGATLGKLACRLSVVTVEGARISYARSTGRYFAKIINQFTLGIGYLIAAFDQEKKGLHDIICNTRVIRV